MKEPTTTNNEINKGDYYITDAGIFQSNGHETKRELSKFKKITNQTTIDKLNQNKDDRR
jgi:hypothetical protein